MTLFVLVIHTLAAILLMTVVLMQSGRGGGLTEGFASAESMFGAKTNAFMVKATAVLAGIFLVTSLGLARMSSKKEESLIPENLVTERLPDIEIPMDLPADDDMMAEDLEAPAAEVDLPAPEAAPATDDVSVQLPASEGAAETTPTAN